MSDTTVIQTKAPLEVRDIVSDKSRFVALVLVTFLGLIGIHRFYVGKTGTGIAQILTFGGFGVWTLIDFFLILFGGFRDKDFRPLVKW